MTTERTGTVATSTAGYGTEIRLRGKWLQSAGFEEGKTYSLTVKSAGVLELRRSAAGEATETFAIVAQRLDHAIANSQLTVKNGGAL